MLFRSPQWGGALRIPKHPKMLVWGICRHAKCCDNDFWHALGSHMVGLMSAACKIRGESRESAACMPCVESSTAVMASGSRSTLLFAETTSHRGYNDGMRAHSGRMGAYFGFP